MKMDRKLYHRQYYLEHPELKERMKKQYQNSEQVRAHRAEYAKTYRLRPEGKEKIMEALRRFQQKPGAKQRQLEYARTYRQSPKGREIIRRYWQKPGAKQRQSEYFRKYRQRPEYKERRRIIKEIKEKEEGECQR